MKKSTKTISLLASATLFTLSSLSASVTTDVVGYTSTTLPGGAGSIFAPSFVNADSYVGVLAGAVAGTESVLSLPDLTPGQFNEPNEDPIYPAYYLEVLDDTNLGDSLDTEGLVIDIISNSGSGVTVDANSALLGIQGDEKIAIRKHLTLGDIFEGATGVDAFGAIVSLYNTETVGSVISYAKQPGGGWINLADNLSGDDAVVYPGTGFVVNNPAEVKILVTGRVKETDTQVSVFGGAVNFVSGLKPLEGLDMNADGRIEDAFPLFQGLMTPYSKGDLQAQATYAVDGGGEIINLGTNSPASIIINGTADALVVNASVDTVYKASGTVITD